MAEELTRDASTDSLPTLRFRLPGRWWPIPLGSIEAAQKSIRELVDNTFGRADDGAILRDGMRKDLLAGVKPALERDGVAMYVALQVIEELPLSVSFTVFLPQQRMTPAIGEDGQAVIGILRQGLEATEPAQVASFVEFDGVGLDGPESRVLRSHRISEAVADPPTLPSLLVNYWVSIPGTKRVALVSFSSAYVELADVMMTFFDSIIRAAYWERGERG